MSRTFSKREKFMLGILGLMLLAAVYSFGVSMPLQARVAAAEQRIAAAEDQLLLEQMHRIQIAKMQKELEEAKAQQPQMMGEIPYYNNLPSVMVELDAIVRQAQTCDISFTDAILGEKLVTRPIALQFTAANYEEAKALINQLAHLRYRCSIDSVELSLVDGTQTLDLSVSPVKVMLEVTFYEQYRDSAQTTEATE